MANTGDDYSGINFVDEVEEQEDLVEDIPKEQRVLRTQAYDKSISDIIGMIKNGDINLDPEYQRNYVWDNKKASLLIESILLNVPIPVIYVAEEENSSWTVIDGLQRLNTLRRFFDNEFKLRGLEVLTELNGDTFASIAPKAARIIKNGILRVILVFKESHPEIKYDIFMRLNRGAIKLNEQELRNCLYRGKFNILLMNLRSNPQFLKILGLDVPHKRMADAELILRYFTFSASYSPETGEIRNYTGKAKSALNRYCDDAKKASDETLNDLSQRFKQTIDKVFSVFGTSAFQRINEQGETDGRLNRAIMDFIMLSFEKYGKETLVLHKDAIKGLLQNLPLQDEGFKDAITYGTTDKKRLEYRLNTWHRNLAQILGPAA